MVEEPDAGLDRGGPAAVEIEGDRDPGLAGLARHARATAFCCLDGERAQRRRHPAVPLPLAAAISRSFSSAFRTVSRSESASGWPAPNVRGTRPFRRSVSAASAAASGLAKRTRTKFVTDGP